MAERGLLDRQYAYYAVRVTLHLAMLGASFVVLALVDILWVQLLNAVFLALVFAQYGFLGHDAGHRQIFKSAKRNDAILLLCGFVTGLTPSWWQDKHNAHHVSPNQIGRDGDIEVSTFVYTEEQALNSTGFLRFMVKYQAFFFYPVLLLTSLSLIFGGIAYMIRRGHVKYPLLEPVLVIGGMALYVGMIFAFLPPWQAGLFIVVHRALAGLHMGSVFAPNHKGMPVLEEDDELDYMRQQILTSRDVRPSPLVDYMYGGLNYQIEHHLFPNMPRNRLKRAKEVVKQFCRERGLPYHETGVWQSNKEILGYMHEVSAVVRRK